MPSRTPLPSQRSATRRGAAFTLIELLVVIGIIGLLIAILLPVLAAARRHSLRLQCLSQQRELSTALFDRAQRHDGYLPLAGTVELRADIDLAQDLPPLLQDSRRTRYAYNRNLGAPFPTYTVLAPFQVSVYRHLAPEESVAATVTEEMAQLKRSAYAQLFQCPAASPLPGGNPMPAESISMGGHRYTFQHFLPLDYALNAGLMGFHHDARHAHRRLRGQLARAGDASRVMLLGDADPSMLTASTFTWSPGLEDHGPFTLADAHGNPAMSGVGQASLDLLRHAGQVNVVFADGHARSVRIDGESLGQVHLLPPQD